MSNFEKCLPMSDQSPDNFEREDHLLRWFKCKHLPESLRRVTIPYMILAQMIIQGLEPGEERTEALRKLLESKDCAVRAKLDSMGS